jgi:hypothetical protein
LARADLLNILYSKKMSPLEFKFDSLFVPSMYNYMTIQDTNSLYNVASSVRYAGNIDMKYKAINDILTKRGFARFHSGTNRVVYRYLEDQNFLIKVAMDRVGIHDNPAEFKNQWLLKPFITKVFEVSPCGAVGQFERILPITSRKEFEYMAPDIYDLLVNNIIGKYVLEDIGTKYFMNWGIRTGFGPVLLDFPYVFELDGNKMHCNLPLIHGQKFPICDGEIDYDIGFNKLVCTKCGKEYNAKDLQVNGNNKLIILKGEDNMNLNVKLMRGNEVICESGKSSEYIKKPEPKPVQSSTPVIKSRLSFDARAILTPPTEERKPELNIKSKFIRPNSTQPVNIESLIDVTEGRVAKIYNTQEVIREAEKYFEDRARKEEKIYTNPIVEKAKEDEAKSAIDSANSASEISSVIEPVAVTQTASLDLTNLNNIKITPKLESEPIQKLVEKYAADSMDEEQENSTSPMAVYKKNKYVSETDIKHAELSEEVLSKY